jgi:hypothetical protein
LWRINVSRIEYLPSNSVEVDISEIFTSNTIEGGWGHGVLFSIVLENKSIGRQASASLIENIFTKIQSCFILYRPVNAEGRYDKGFV